LFSDGAIRVNFLFNGGGVSNKGDEAMMLTVQHELARRFPQANFIVRASFRSRELASAHGLLVSNRPGGSVARALRLGCACLKDRDVRRASRLDWVVGEAIAEVGNVDCVLDFSGFNYSDAWGVASAKRGLAWAEYCHARGKPFICLPQAWGPFHMAGVAEATRRLCAYSTLIYARDKVSRSYLTELLGPGADNVRTAPDMAFLFVGETACAGREFLKSLGVEPGRIPVVAITPNLRVYERCPGVGVLNEYVQLLTKVARHCIDNWHANVVLIPHTFCMHETPCDDDRFVCGLVEVGVSNPRRCFTVRRHISAAMAKSIEGQVDLVIGSRFHSCVFALSSGVPAVALGWAHKYVELMALIGLESDALIHTEFSEARVMEMLDAAWERRERSREIIEHHLEKIRADVASLFDSVASIVSGRGDWSPCPAMAASLSE